MRYLLLIYTAEPAATRGRRRRRMGAEIGGLRRVHARWLTRARRCSQAGEALHPTSAATTVRVRDGQTLTTDGPFAETKEALGGFYLIEAREPRRGDRGRGADPRRAGTAAIEVRPIWEFAAETRPPRPLPAPADAARPSSTACSARNRAGRSRR